MPLPRVLMNMVMQYTYEPPKVHPSLILVFSHSSLCSCSLVFIAFFFSVFSFVHVVCVLAKVWLMARPAETKTYKAMPAGIVLMSNEHFLFDVANNRVLTVVPQRCAFE